MADKRSIAIEIVYAVRAEQPVLALSVAEGTTVDEAITLSGLLQRYPAIATRTTEVGIYGQLVRRDTILREGDRVEIYRPLIADPKQARRRRAMPAR